VVKEEEGGEEDENEVERAILAVHGTED